MKKKSKPTDSYEAENTLSIEQTANQTGAQAVARKVLEPNLRHAVTASAFAGKVLGNQIEPPGLMDYVTEMQAVTKRAQSGDVTIASRLLAAQAITLDSMFSELARRAASNMGEYMDATERYARLALKAQTNSRATLEALIKLHQPREQTVRHIHVNEGGQAVVAETFHAHTGGKQNAKSVKQSHATRAASKRPALPSQNAQGDGVPIASGKGPETVPDARRD